MHCKTRRTWTLNSLLFILRRLKNLIEKKTYIILKSSNEYTICYNKVSKEGIVNCDNGVMII